MSAFTPHAEYHPDIDILYIYLRDAAIVRTRGLGPWRNVDLTADGNVVGVEFVNASDGVDLRGVPESSDVVQAMEAIGLSLPVIA
ncbi:MAG: DUF2283 domain-containing protein [Dehalococcoidia bacterium]